MNARPPLAKEVGFENMEKEKEIVNRVASSSLVSIDLEEFYTAGERVLFDMKDCLFQGMILREKDFRDFIKAHDWSRYQGKFVAITSSVEAIIPTWAYMLLSVAVQPFARKVFFGSLSMPFPVSPGSNTVMPKW